MQKFNNVTQNKPKFSSWVKYNNIIKPNLEECKININNKSLTKPNYKQS